MWRFVSTMCPSGLQTWTIRFQTKNEDGGGSTRYDEIHYQLAPSHLQLPYKSPQPKWLDLCVHSLFLFSLLNGWRRSIALHKVPIREDMEALASHTEYLSICFNAFTSSSFSLKEKLPLSSPVHRPNALRSSTFCSLLSPPPNTKAELSPAHSVSLSTLPQFLLQLIQSAQPIFVFVLHFCLEIVLGHTNEFFAYFETSIWDSWNEILILSACLFLWARCCFVLASLENLREDWEKRI